MSEIKKYPVTYKGQEYEVRWEKEEGPFGCNTYLKIYEVHKNQRLLFKQKQFVYAFKEYDLLNKIYNKYHKISVDPEIYIFEIKELFEQYENLLEAKRNNQKTTNNQLATLEEWDGVIE